MRRFNPEPARCCVCDVRLSRVPADHERRCREIADCTYCQENKGQMAPRHFASPRCESGGHNHCSCDICW